MLVACPRKSLPLSLSLARTYQAQSSKPDLNPNAYVVNAEYSGLLNRCVPLKEHAWKAIRVSRIEQHRNTAARNRFNNFPLHNAR